MQTVVVPSELLVVRAADAIESMARSAIDERGQFTCALSGGTTPWKMLAELAQRNIAWERVHLFQVDERVAPSGHVDRNATALGQSLGAAAGRAQLHLMPVEAENLEGATDQYAAELARVCGGTATLDLVHLGLGDDGHTASLVPNDAALEVRDRDVALTGEYKGRRRMTLTYPAIDRARRILWLASGASKAPMLARLSAADRSIPAGVVSQAKAVLYTDVNLGG
jgi:6-phosphogluconolactonase